jgi:hypothetical protein
MHSSETPGEASVAKERLSPVARALCGCAGIGFLALLGIFAIRLDHAWWQKAGILGPLFGFPGVGLTVLAVTGRRILWAEMFVRWPVVAELTMPFSNLMPERKDSDDA